MYKGLNNENNLALCLLGSFACLLEPDDFFQNQQFQKNILGIPSVSNDLDPDQARHLSDGIWVETKVITYQQIALVGKELTIKHLLHKGSDL